MYVTVFLNEVPSKKSHYVIISPHKGPKIFHFFQVASRLLRFAIGSYWNKYKSEFRDLSLVDRAILLKKNTSFPSTSKMLKWHKMNTEVCFDCIVFCIVSHIESANQNMPHSSNCVIREILKNKLYNFGLFSKL